MGVIRVLDWGAGSEGSNSVMRCLVLWVSFWAVDVSSKVMADLGFDWGLDEGTEKESFMVLVILYGIERIVRLGLGLWRNQNGT